MNKKQLQSFKKLINLEKQRVLDSMNLKEDALKLLEIGQMDDIDRANSTYQAAHDLRMKKRDVLYFKKLNLALKKIDDEEYGTCEECGCNINIKRLKARPTADLCIECKDDQEKEELSNILGKASKSLMMNSNVALG